MKKKILLVIPNTEKEGKHYLAVKKLSAILHGISSKHNDNFFLNWLQSFRTKNKHTIFVEL